MGTRARARRQPKKPPVAAENENAAIKLAFLGIVAFAGVVGYSAFSFLHLLEDGHASPFQLSVLRHGLALAMPGALIGACLAAGFFLVHLLMGEDKPRS